MSLTIKGTYTIGGYSLVGTSFGVLNPVTVTGSIDAGTGSPAALYAEGPGGWTVTNSGTITGDLVNGIELASAGVVANGALGSVSGYYGILMNDGGGVTNQATGRISGQRLGVAFLAGAGTLANDGTISGASKDGVYLDSGVVTNQPHGSISGAYGVVIKGGGSLANAGRITGGTGTGQSGVYLNNGPITNQAGAYISGGWGLYVHAIGTMVNAGTVIGASQGGGFLGGGTLNNQGTMTGVWGVAIQGGIGTVSNYGVLDGTSQSGAYLSGGLVTNHSNGLIEGASGVVIRNGAGTIVNDGEIAATSSSGYGVYLPPGFAGRVVVNPGAVFDGLVSGGNTIGAIAISTLEFGAAASPGTVSGLGTRYVDFGAVTFDAGATWSLSGANNLSAGTALLDQGTLMLNGAALTDGGVATISGPVGIAASVVVTGPASSLQVTGPLIVGMAGDGQVEVDSHGTVSTGDDAAAPAAGVEVGEAAGGSGDVTVAGSQSLLANTGEFIVGDVGVGTLSIQSGGTVTTTPGSVAGLAGLAIADTAGASGSLVEINGTGSQLDVTGLLNVGSGGSGALELSGGATVTAGSLDAGNAVAAVGQINLSGTNTGLDVSGAATVADDGTGVLSVLSGATFSAASLTIGNAGNSSGAMIVSGSGSVVNLSGSLNIGTALGTGDLTVGPGAEVHASVINLRGQVVLEGGLLDPTVLYNQSVAGGTGTVGAEFTIDEGTIQATGSEATPTGRLQVVLGTIVGGGTLTIRGGTTVDGTTVNNPGILLINKIGVLEVTGPVLNAASTTFMDNGTTAGAVVTTGSYSLTNSVVDVNFLTATGELLLDDIAGFGGTITTYQPGDLFVVTGGTLSNLGVSNGNTLTFADSGAGAVVGGIDRIIFGSAVDPSLFSIVGGNTVQAVACFAAGTRITTDRGPVAVEALDEGDHVVTADGACEPIVWIGRRAVNCRAHPMPETVWPVRVKAEAFGKNVPVRDLYLSPDHAVFVNEVLIPVKLLVNGTSIAQVKRPRVTYFHVELPAHSMILAEGQPVESYLERGDRANFQQDGTAIRLFPDFAAKLAPDAAMEWETRGAAPLVMAGKALEGARAALAANARRRRSRREGPGAKSVSVASLPRLHAKDSAARSGPG